MLPSFSQDVPNSATIAITVEEKPVLGFHAGTYVQVRGKCSLGGIPGPPRPHFRPWLSALEPGRSEKCISAGAARPTALLARLLRSFLLSLSLPPLHKQGGEGSVETTVRLQNGLGYAETFEANAAYGSQQSSTYAFTAVQPRWMGAQKEADAPPRPARRTVHTERVCYRCSVMCFSACFFPAAGLESQLEMRACQTHKSFQAREEKITTQKRKSSLSHCTVAGTSAVLRSLPRPHHSSVPKPSHLSPSGHRHPLHPLHPTQRNPTQPQPTSAEAQQLHGAPPGLLRHRRLRRPPG